MNEIPFALLRGPGRIVMAIMETPGPTIVEREGRRKRMSIQSASAENADPLVLPMIRPDQLAEARYESPSRIFLRFADRLEGIWTFKELGLDMSNMKLKTIKASASGTSVEVKSKWGQDVQLDSSSLRVMVDPKYGAEIQNKLDILARRIGL